jgi:hemerythrin
MNQIKWLKDYRVGVKKIDEQHRELFGLVSRLQDILTQGWNSDKIREVFDLLIEGIIMHFSEEEGYMRMYRYNDQLSHVVQHRELVREIERLETQWNMGRLVATPELVDYLHNWLVLHVEGPDKKLGLFLQERGQA